MFLPFKNNVFDVVVVSQVFEYVDKPLLLVTELKNLLLKEGIIYFEGVNKLFVLLTQKIRFVSKLFFKGEIMLGNSYYLWEMKKFFKGFCFSDKTAVILKNPKKYRVKTVPSFVSFFLCLLPDPLLSTLIIFSPNWITILKKN